MARNAGREWELLRLRGESTCQSQKGNTSALLAGRKHFAALHFSCPSRKMATRGKRSIGFFADLNCLSTADFAPQANAKRRTVDHGRFFEVERIITSRQGKEEKEYLVKWLDFSPFEASWEPREHLTQQCLKYYEDPNPCKNLILNEVVRLRIAIAKSLKNPSTRQPVTVEFRGDVFRKLFSRKGEQHGCWKLLEQEHFARSYFPDNWHCMLDLHGQGTKISFPVKVRHFISWSPKNFQSTTAGVVTEAKRAFQEKITVNFIKVAA